MSLSLGARICPDLSRTYEKHSILGNSACSAIFIALGAMGPARRSTRHLRRAAHELLTAARIDALAAVDAVHPGASPKPVAPGAAAKGVVAALAVDPVATAAARRRVGAATRAHAVAP
jgi:hypothetical protein